MQQSLFRRNCCDLYKIAYQVEYVTCQCNGSLVEGGPGQKHKNFIYLVSFDMCSVHVLYVPTHVRNPVQTSTALGRFVAKQLSVYHRCCVVI